MEELSGIFELLGTIVGFIFEVIGIIWNAGWGGKLAIILAVVLAVVNTSLGMDSWETKVRNESNKNLRRIANDLEKIRKGKDF